MITPATSTTARIAARASLPLVTLGLALLAVPAHADPAEGWGGYTNPPDVSALHALGLLAGVPLLLFVLIGLAVYVPAMVRGEDVSPTGAGVENQWLGGPRQGAKELAPGETESSETGGAHGTW